MKRAGTLSLCGVLSAVVIASGIVITTRASAANPCIKAGDPVFAGCVEYGAIDGSALASASPTLACLGEAISFTLNGGLSDRGGSYELIQNYTQSYCPPRNSIVRVSGLVQYSWVVKSGYQIVASGSGKSASYTPTIAGTYTCDFKARVVRACAPLERVFSVSATTVGPSESGVHGITEIYYPQPYPYVEPGDAWGATVLVFPAFQIETYCNGSGSWMCKIVWSQGQLYQGTHLIPGASEVLPELIQQTSDISQLEEMKTHLAHIAQNACQGASGSWYAIEAVQQHEDRHVQRYLAGMVAAFSSLKSNIESLSVLMEQYPSASSAKAAIRALAGYGEAEDDFYAEFQIVTQREVAHDNCQDFIDAEMSVVRPLIEMIEQRLQDLGA